MLKKTFLGFLLICFITPNLLAASKLDSNFIYRKKSTAGSTRVLVETAKVKDLWNTYKYKDFLEFLKKEFGFTDHELKVLGIKDPTSYMFSFAPILGKLLAHMIQKVAPTLSEIIDNNSDARVSIADFTRVGRYLARLAWDQKIEGKKSDLGEEGSIHATCIHQCQHNFGHTCYEACLYYRFHGQIDHFYSLFREALQKVNPALNVSSGWGAVSLNIPLSSISKQQVMNYALERLVKEWMSWINYKMDAKQAKNGVRNSYLFYAYFGKDKVVEAYKQGKSLHDLASDLLTSKLTSDGQQITINLNNSKPFSVLDIFQTEKQYMKYVVLDENWWQQEIAKDSNAYIWGNYAFPALRCYLYNKGCNSYVAYGARKAVENALVNYKKLKNALESAYYKAIIIYFTTNLTPEEKATKIQEIVADAFKTADIKLRTVKTTNWTDTAQKLLALANSDIKMHISGSAVLKRTETSDNIYYNLKADYKIDKIWIKQKKRMTR